MSIAPDKNLPSSYDNNTQGNETVLRNGHTWINSNGHIKAQFLAERPFIAVI
jgi:hypothetical protein